MAIVNEQPVASGVAARSTCRIRIFGSVGIDQGDGPVSIGGKRQQQLLALLAIRVGSFVDLDWLAEHLWDDDERPDPSLPPLRTYVSRLRRALPEGAREWIETETGGYRLTAPEQVVEHLRFGRLRSEAALARSANDPVNAKRLLDEALELWRGDPFRELEDFAWAQPEIERLKHDRLEMLEERWETELALGRHTQITGELSAFINEHGLRDRAVRQYALALHRSGRTTEALRTIAAHRKDLAEQSGLDPSREMRDLESSLLADDPELDADQIWRPLRGYRLLEEVGSGAFSIVWRGVQPSVGRDVAIKQIRAELAAQPEFIRRFEAEAQLVARIEHPYIVPLIDFWRDPTSAYLVMRWLGGGTLERRLDDGPLSIGDATSLAWQIGGALSAAHAHGVVHRDVKTANIMFDEHGHALLGDFGIALTTEESGGPEAALSPGSPSYSSPEQVRREPLRPTADIFSLGVVLYECLTGTLPDSGGGPDASAAGSRRAPTVSELRADVPDAMSDAIASAIAFDPADRFETVAEFVSAFGADREASSALADGPEARSLSGDPDSPYVGLHAFDGSDSDRFFGRERLVQELVQRLSADTVASRCVVLVGPSGSGKSSVVRAGLVPAIRRGEVPGSDRWFTTTMVPGVNVYASLEAALLRVAVNPPHSLLGELRDGQRGVLRSVRRCLGSDDDRVLLVIDQFEELFIGASSDDADAFLDALSVAVEDPTSPLRLAVTIRADYYDRPLRHPAFAPIVKASAVEVTPLAGDELERAIVEPARLIGVEFERGLVSRLATESVGQAAPLPLLQYTLSELFDQRVGRVLTLAAYEEIGGISGALAARAESLYSGANDVRRAAIRSVFGRLTNPGEASADLRRRAWLTDVGDDPAAAWVVARYGEARLLTFDRDVESREPTIEVAHEALLREWPRLSNWLDEDSELLREVDAIGSAADIWSAGGRSDVDASRGPRLDSARDILLASPDRLRPVDVEFIETSLVAADAQLRTEAVRIRRLRRLVAGIGVALVVALLAGALAIRQSNRADDEADRARGAAARADEQRSQAELATLISRSASQQNEDPDLAMLLALEAHRRSPGAETEQAVLSALGSTALSNRVAINRPLVDPDGPCPLITTGADGIREFGVDTGRLVSRDLLTGMVTDHGPSPAPCVEWLGDEEADRRVAVTDDGLRLWLGPFAGSWDIEREFIEATFLVSRQIPPTGNVLFRAGRISIEPGSLAPAVTLIDTATGEQVGPVISEGIWFDNAAESSEGALVAVSFGRNPESEEAGVTIAVDGNTGAELWRVATRQPVRAAVVDDQRGEVVVGLLASASLITLDMATGDVLAEVETTATDGLVQGGLGVAPDGLLFAVSSSQIEQVDRRRGPAGFSGSVRDVAFARIRPDGTVLTGTVDEQTTIFDVDSNVLVEQAFRIEPFSHVEIHDGVATIVRDSGGDPETIDLATSARVDHVLIAPDGVRRAPVVAHQADSGLWTVDREEPLLIQWQNGTQSQAIALDGFPALGHRLGDLWAIASNTSIGFETAALVDLTAEPPGIAMTVPAPSYTVVHPSPDGGMFVLDFRGRLRIYDASGVRTRQIDIADADVTGQRLAIGAKPPAAIAVNPATGNLAIRGARGEVLLVDPETGDVDVLPGVDNVHDFEFVKNGEFMAIVESDGSIVLWNLARNESAGLVWRGTGAGSRGNIVWYDNTADSMFAATSGRIVEISINPQRWVERACEVVGRDLTQAEWDRLVPGDDPITSACA